jgi:simple sugar transport system permease protein
MNSAETVLIAMLAGVLVLGAMVAYATSYLTGNPWLGVLAAAGAGAALGGLHGLLCALTRVNDVAMGIAILLAGNGIAFFFGKPFVQPSAPGLPGIPFGGWSSVPQVQSALTVSPLFLVGVAWMFRATRLGLRLRIVGDSADAARALGLNINFVTLVSGAPACSRPWRATRWPASAARSSAWCIPEAGTRACRPARD